MARNKERFSKVKIAKACEDETHEVTNENNTRDAIMKGELNRDECDNDDAHDTHRQCGYVLVVKPADPYAAYHV